MSYFPDTEPRTENVLSATGGPVILVDSDTSKLIRVDNSVTVPTGLPVGFNCRIQNVGGSDVELTTTGVTIQGLNTAPDRITASGVMELTITDTDTALIRGDVTTFSGLTKAFSFDGVDENLDGDTADGLLGPAADDTVNVAVFAWVDWSGSGAEYVIAKGGSWSGYRIYTNVTTMRVQIFTNVGNQFKEYQTPASTLTSGGGWKHIGFTFDGANGGADGTFKLWIDGVEQTPTINTDQNIPYIGQNTGAFEIGALNSASFFTGEIAGACAFAASGMTFGSTEVNELYGGGTGGAIRPTDHSLAANLIFSYDGSQPGDDMTGGTGQISSGAGTDGPLTPVNTEVGDLVNFP